MLEFVEAVLSNPYVLHALVGVSRSVLGWAENVMEKGRVEGFDFKKLGATIIRVGLLSFGLAVAGAPLGTAIPVDMGLFALKKK